MFTSAAQGSGLAVTCMISSSLMTLLVHLRVLAIWRRGITAAVTIGTVVDVAAGCAILCHSLRKPRALGSILRAGRVARSCRLVADGWQLRVTRTLTRHSNGLSHLSIDRSVGTVVVTSLTVGGTLSLFVSLSLSFFLLLLCLPLLANFFEFCGGQVSAI